LLVIERATGKRFPFPNLSRSEVETIAYIYHAIVDRTFGWPIGTITVAVPATQERLAALPPGGCPPHQLLGPKLVTKTLLSHSIVLGNEIIAIDDMIVEHPDEVRRELARDDGHLVEVNVRSLSGRARIDLPDAPCLPDKPRDSDIEALIDLESQLDARLADRYHALAAATLADLTEEEIREITSRDKIVEETFFRRLLRTARGSQA
jgi:hypothetical protein